MSKQKYSCHSNVKVMLIVFCFDWNGIIHHEFMPHGHSIWVLLGYYRPFEGTSVKEEAWGMNKQDLEAVPWCCNCSRNALICDFLEKHITSVVLHYRFGPCILFYVRKVDMHPNRLDLDSTRDRRKFPTGPLRHPIKCIPKHVLQLEKTMGEVYQQWKEVLWNNKSDYVVSKAINK